MAYNGSAYTVRAIRSWKAKTIGQPTPITVSELSTSTDAYKMVNPVAEVAAEVGALAELVLFAQSFLGSQGEQLENVLRDINITRLKDESDDSIRQNAPRIFSPGSTFDTDINPDIKAETQFQLFNIKTKSDEQLFTQMRARFNTIKGNTGQPLIMGDYFKADAYRLYQLGIHIMNIIKDYIVEDFTGMVNTDWLYKSAALRVPGVRDAKVKINNYNEILIYVYVDERRGVDYRERPKLFNTSGILQDVQFLAKDYLPKEETINFKKPLVNVKQCNTKPVYINGSYRGATEEEVCEAIEDYFYNNKGVGVSLNCADLTDYIRNNTSVTMVSFGYPLDDDLIPDQYEVVDVGFIDLQVA